MRVIAGSLKGRKLQVPDWPGLRPTSDRLRETLFNILAPRITGSHFLDGYAGTGAVGIEALSRGAARVTFVDDDARARRLIETNLRKCGVPERHAIIRAGFTAAARTAGGYDLVFLDPPYGAAALTGALESAASLVNAETLLILEHATRDRAPAALGSLERTREVVHGDSTLAFYRRVKQP
jgi:16S rRNA (guanine(966)-N(2))-methyltransferase RsmD